MNPIVIHTHSRKKHIADADVPELPSTWSRVGHRQALCNPNITGRTPDAVLAAGWLTRGEIDAQPWCKRCERRAKAAGVIA